MRSFLARYYQALFDNSRKVAWVFIAVAAILSASAWMVAARDDPKSAVQGRARTTEPTSAAEGELHVGYLPDGLESVGKRLSDEQQANPPFVSHLYMYDDPTTYGSSGHDHGADRQLNVNVMVGAFPANYYDWMEQRQGATAVDVRGNRAMLTFKTERDASVAWVEKTGEAVFVSSRGLSSDELLHVARGLTRA